MYSLTGPELKARRRAHGINQTQMAQLIECSRHAVSYWETQAGPMTSKRLRWGVPALMCKVLGIAVLPNYSRLCAPAPARQRNRRQSVGAGDGYRALNGRDIRHPQVIGRATIRRPGSGAKLASAPDRDRRRTGREQHCSTRQPGPDRPPISGGLRSVRACRQRKSITPHPDTTFLRMCFQTARHEAGADSICSRRNACGGGFGPVRTGAQRGGVGACPDHTGD